MNKERKANKFCNREGLSWENEYAKEAFIAGYDSAITRMKEYFFNTEEHPRNISEEYLLQTVKFLLNE